MEVDKKKARQIYSLIRDDYGFLIFQEMIAEIVVNTQYRNKDDLQKRYDTIIQAFLGPPDTSLKKEKSGSKNDEKDLGRIAILANKYKPKTEEKYGIGEACWEIARKKISLTMKSVRKYRSRMHWNLRKFEQMRKD